jgi:hypothetical protein
MRADGVHNPARSVGLLSTHGGTTVMPKDVTMMRAAAAGLAGTGAVVGAMGCARRMGLTRIEFPSIIATALDRERFATRAA